MGTQCVEVKLFHTPISNNADITIGTLSVSVIDVITDWPLSSFINFNFYTVLFVFGGADLLFYSVILSYCHFCSEQCLQMISAVA